LLWQEMSGFNKPDLHDAISMYLYFGNSVLKVCVQIHFW
jgi:hypothetical protein